MRKYGWTVLIFVLLAVLVVLEAWTYYLGRPSVTFERYVHTEVPEIIQDIRLRRYKAAHSPHLFSFKIAAADETALLHILQKQLGLIRVKPEVLPSFLKGVDAEMVEVMKKSPYLYVSKSYDIEDYRKGRLAVVFRDRDTLYLYLNGDL